MGERCAQVPSRRPDLLRMAYVSCMGGHPVPAWALGSLLVPRGAFSVPERALRGPFGTIFDPKIEIREHHWTPKLDFGGSQKLFCEVLASICQISFENARTQCAKQDDRMVTSRRVQTMRSFFGVGG